MGKPILPKGAYGFPIALLPLPFFILTPVPSFPSLSSLIFLGRWRLQNNAQCLAKVRGWTIRGHRTRPRHRHGRVEVWRAVISQVLPRDLGRGGAVPRAVWLQPLPVLSSHLCIFSVPFVNEDLVKSLQSRGERTFWCLCTYVQLGWERRQIG